MALVRNKERVSVSKSHNYTKEKVQKAEDFLKNEYGKNQRKTPIERIVEVYNEVRGTTDSISNCRRCNQHKYILGIQNYAKYGRLVLENEGVVFDDVEEVEEVKEPLTNEKERIITGVEETEVVEEVEEIKEIEQQPAPKKRGRPKKSEDKE